MNGNSFKYVSNVILPHMMMLLSNLMAGVNKTAQWWCLVEKNEHFLARDRFCSLTITGLLDVNSISYFKRQLILSLANKIPLN